ncbi:MAG TPA: 4-(cytidine 5'-diphospho)-2-C-methyl-D-erythritol kinase [Burkholderiaceae bacterium]|jgi:4-diphosphocytidyl-2-C-methyl-D-erythritol kinase|nr:4-(cytidine 5'-diphospho)-2-C-methyl-D-erythritol kinase [Burkholderiaceae bacterium]
MTRLFLGLPAPAKLNLFLHVLGRRADGYHELQSVFVPIDLADCLDFERRDDGAIERTGDVIGDPARDLAVRAARALQQASGTSFGVSIRVEKRIPAGSGMGGGSSDAATTLIALNRLWELNWPRARLTALAPALGADVPFFLGPGPALVEGIGERVTPLPVPSTHYAVVFPRVAVSTAEIFGDPGLTRDSKPHIIAAPSAAMADVARATFGVNDLEAVARRRYPDVARAIEYLSAFGPARMTGSGSAVFVAVDGEPQARAALAALPSGWSGWAVRGLTEHPLAAW